jgi:hypothetical protein
MLVLPASSIVAMFFIRCSECSRSRSSGGSETVWSSSGLFRQNHTGLPENRIYCLPAYPEKTRLPNYYFEIFSFFSYVRAVVL